MTKYLETEIESVGLSRAEEMALFQRLRKGDKAAEEAIVGQFILFAQKTAKATAGATLGDQMHPDDISSAAHDGLLAAMKKFKHSRRVRFSTYLRFRVAGAVKDFRRKEARSWKVKKAAADSGHAELWAEILHQSLEDDNHAFLMERLKGVINDLPEREKAVVQFRLRPLKYKETGALLVPAVTGSRAEQIFKGAFVKIAEAMKKAKEEM